MESRYPNPRSFFGEAPSPEAVYEAVEVYVGLLRAATESVAVYTNYAPAEVYSHAAWMDEVRRTSEKVKVQVCTGPVVLAYVDSAGLKHSGLVDLAQDSTIELYVRDSIGDRSPYVVIDATKVEPEPSADKLSVDDELQRIRLENPSACVQYLLAQVAGHGATLCRNPDDGVLLLAGSEMQSIAWLAKGRQNYLKLRKFQDLAKRLLDERNSMQVELDEEFRKSVLPWYAEHRQQ